MSKIVDKLKSLSHLRSWGILVAAVAAGGSAFWLSDAYLRSQESELRTRLLGNREAVREVVVATRDLMPGDVAGPDTMAVARVPSAHLSAAAVRPNEFSRYAGQVINRPMSRGEPLLSHFATGKAIERFSDLLQPGERAVTLQVNEVNSNAGMLVSGDYVDIFVLAKPPKDATEGDNGKVLLPIRERVRVLAVGRSPLLTREQDFTARRSQRDADRYATITVGASSDDASKLTLANSLGDLVFILRNSEDERLGDGQPLDRRLLWQELASNNSSVFQFYSAAKSKNGLMEPIELTTESLNATQGRRAVKSVPVITASSINTAKAE